MVPKKYSSEAIVLSRRNFSEADRILVLYTRNYGKLSVLAKGVRKPKSRKRSSIEIFSRIKFSAVRSKSLDIVTEVELIEFYKIVRTNLKKVSVAYFFVETVNKLTRDEERNDELYQLLCKYMDMLRTSDRLKNLRYDFIFDTLVLIGFWPNGKEMLNHDNILEDIVEREMTTARVGKLMLS